MTTSPPAAPPAPDPFSSHQLRRLTRLCATLTGHPEHADDLAQETLLQAWRIRTRLRPDADAAGQQAWLDAVARNVCHRWRVRSARHLARETPAPEPGPVTDTGVDELAEVLEREELVELLDRALALLPATTRDTLVARYVEEEQPQQIARRLRVSPDAVSMRLTRGRARLREVLESDLADEPVARAWVERHGAAWRPSRLVCPTCGRPGLAVQRDVPHAVVQLRCERCDLGSVATVWRLDNPTVVAQLGGVRRPSGMAARMATWAHGWWQPAIAAGQAPCTRCGRPSPVVPYERPEPTDPRTRRGWHATCAACGEQLTTSLLGLALALPEVRRLREACPGARAVPTRHEVVGGRPALVVGMRAEQAGRGVDVVYDDASQRLHAVVEI